MSMTPQAVYKLLLVGDSGVGKSCLLLRFSDGAFNESHISTIGMDFKVKTVVLRDHAGQDLTVKLQIWDTAGQERFRTITSSYYRGASGIILVYSIADRASFDNVRRWLGDVDRFAAPDVTRLLVGNKSDLAHAREVPYEEGAALAASLNIPFAETSARDNIGVGDAFMALARGIVARMASRPPSATSSAMTLLAEDFGGSRSRRAKLKSKCGGCAGA